MAPEQTLGKPKPYLFTQGEAILNRTWIPTQDSPGIRQTWEARITVPEGLTTVMSGESQSTLGETAPGNRRTFSFKMDKPVAPYLNAMAIGDLRFQDRKSVVEGKSVSVRVDRGGRRIIKKKNTK